MVGNDRMSCFMKGIDWVVILTFRVFCKKDLAHLVLLRDKFKMVRAWYGHVISEVLLVNLQQVLIVEKEGGILNGKRPQTRPFSICQFHVNQHLKKLPKYLSS
jgi:hypothetical protein